MRLKNEMNKNLITTIWLKLIYCTTAILIYFRPKTKTKSKPGAKTSAAYWLIYLKVPAYTHQRSPTHPEHTEQ